MDKGMDKGMNNDKLNSIKELLDKDKIVCLLLTFFSHITISMLTPVIATFMTANSINTVYIGANSSIYFIAFIIGTIFADKKMRNKNLKMVLVFGILLIVLGSIIFPFTESIFLMFVFRISIGFGMGVLIVGNKIFLYRLTDNNKVGIISGLLILSMILGSLIGFVAGPFLFKVFDKLPFFVAGLSSLICLLVLLTIKERIVMPEESKEKVFNKLKYPLLGIFIYGFADATTFTLLPVYIIQQNFSTNIMGLILGIFLVGAIVTTVPSSYLADKIDKKIIIIISLIIGIIPTIGIIFVFNNTWMLLILFFFAGAGIGPIRPLVLAITNQDLVDSELPSGNSLFNIFASLGSMTGPLVSSIVMEHGGNNFIFLACTGLCTLYLLVSVLMYCNLSKGTNIS